MKLPKNTILLLILIGFTIVFADIFYIFVTTHIYCSDVTNYIYCEYNHTAIRIMGYVIGIFISVISYKILHNLKLNENGKVFGVQIFQPLAARIEFKKWLRAEHRHHSLIVYSCLFISGAGLFICFNNWKIIYKLF